MILFFKALGLFIRNLAALLEQDEYLFYAYFRGLGGVVKLHGTCGHYYAVEHAESLGHQLRGMEAPKRQKLALLFLDLVHQLDTAYLPGSGPNDATPLHMCDVKLDNFGVDVN